LRVSSSRRTPVSKEYMGYLEFGTDTVTNALAEHLKQQPHVTIRTSTQAEKVEVEQGKVTGVRLKDGEFIAADQVISTVAIPVLLNLVPDLSGDYRKKIEQIDYIGVVCMLLHLNRPFSDAFWTNINDPEISFNGYIEYSRLNQRLFDKDIHILYIPYYLHWDEPRYNFSAEDLFKEYVPMLRRLVPEFDESWVKSYQVFRAKYAQAICHTHFVDLVPEHEAPIQGLYVTDSTQFYPEDRTISAAIRVGRNVARLINNKNQK